MNYEDAKHNAAITKKEIEAKTLQVLVLINHFVLTDHFVLRSINLSILQITHVSLKINAFL